MDENPTDKMERLHTFVQWIIKAYGDIEFNKVMPVNIRNVVNERHSAYLEKIVKQAREVMSR